MSQLHIKNFAQNVEFNTFIGGVGSEVYTPILLAQKLNIHRGRIQKFAVVDNEVRARIRGNYSLAPATQNAVFSNSLTYFKDNDRLVKMIGNNAFRNMTNLETLEIYGVLTFDVGGLEKISNTKIVELYFPEFNTGKWGNLSIQNNAQLKRLIAPNAIWEDWSNKWLESCPNMELIDLRKAKQIGRSTTERGSSFTNVGSNGVAKFHQDIVNVAVDGNNPDINMMSLYNKGWEIQLYNDAGEYVSNFTNNN